ncbi:hypothetical protein Unana1_05418 [Umbelopsis nana]
MSKARYFPLIDEGSPVKRVAIRLFLSFLFIGIFVVIVVPTYISFRHSNEQRQEDGCVVGFTDAELQEFNQFDTLNETAIIVFGRVASVDPITDVLKLSFQYSPTGTIGSIAITSPITIITDADAKTYSAGSRLPNTDYTVALYGDYSTYPFDVYTGSFGINIVKGTPANSSGIHTPMLLLSNLAQWRINSTGQQITDTPDGSELYEFNFEVKRATTTIAFSIIIVILLWCLSLASCLITIQIVLRGRALDLPIMALNATLLFAMPALRNAQPAVPPIGIGLDVLGFFFNMCLVACSFLCVVLLHILRWQLPKPAAVAAEKA